MHTVFAIAAALFLLVACGGGGGGGKPGSMTQQPNQPVVDTDGDGVADAQDAFPRDAAETMDSDGDGVGDNADAFPRDPLRTVTVTPIDPIGVVGLGRENYHRYAAWELRVGQTNIVGQMDIPFPIATVKFTKVDQGTQFNLFDIGYEMSGYLPDIGPTGLGKALWHGIARGISTQGDPYAGTSDSRNQKALLSFNGDVGISVDFDKNILRAEITNIGYPDIVGETIYLSEPPLGEWHFRMTQLNDPGITDLESALNTSSQNNWSINGSFRGKDHSAIIGTFRRHFFLNHPKYPGHLLKGIFGAAKVNQCTGVCE